MFDTFCFAHIQSSSLGKIVSFMQFDIIFSADKNKIGKDKERKSSSTILKLQMHEKKWLDRLAYEHKILHKSQRFRYRCKEPKCYSKSLEEKKKAQNKMPFSLKKYI